MLAVLKLGEKGDLSEVLIWAAVAGLIGSIVGELITTRGRSGDWGGFDPPRWRDSKRWYDLGSIASIPLGIVAGILAVLVLAPEHDVVENGVTTTTLEWDALLGTAAVGGLAGATFLRVLQDRFVAVAKVHELRGIVQSAEASLPAKGETADTAPLVENVKQANTDEAAKGVADQIVDDAAKQIESTRKILNRALVN